MKATTWTKVLFAAAAVGLGSTQAANAVVEFGIDTNGGSAFTTIDSITWSNSNAVSVGALPILAVGQEFFTYYQAQFASGTLGISLEAGSDPDIHVYAGMNEVVTSLVGSFATFEVVDDVNNFIHIYDGATLILSAVPIAGSASSSSYDASFPGDNSGVFNVVGAVTFYDASYFDFDGAAAPTISILASGTSQEPFGTPPTNANGFQDINGTPIVVTVPPGGPDFLFGVTGNSQFEVIPEPVTATLGLLSLGALGLATRRRRA